jgi:hypothetical protein
MQWSDGMVQTAMIRSNLGGLCRVRSNVEFLVRSERAAVKPLEIGPRLTVFQTEPGKAYTLKPAIK